MRPLLTLSALSFVLAATASLAAGWVPVQRLDASGLAPGSPAPSSPAPGGPAPTGAALHVGEADAELVARMVRGDRTAVALLYQRHQGPLFGLARSMSRAIASQCLFCSKHVFRYADHSGISPNRSMNMT